jgi:uncharacterized protein (TIGR02147 family)
MISLHDLVQREDARAFLRDALALRYQSQDRINLSDFSRRAGFASRSYLSELLAGKKGFSRDSIQKIRSALKLPRPCLDYFEALVLHECPELRKRGQSQEALVARLKQLREKTLESAEVEKTVRRVSKSFTSPQVLQVYAALGTRERGASLGEIEKRTGLKIEVIARVLERLKECGALLAREDRYFPVQRTLDAFGLEHEEGFERLVKESAAWVQTQAREIIRRETGLVFHSSLSVQSQRLAEFHAELKTAIFDVFDRFQDDEGDVVQNFLVSGHS